MKTTIRFSFLALSLGLCPDHPAVRAQTPSTLVVPGRSLGRLTLGMTPIQVHKIVGKPKKRVRLSSTLSSEKWFDKRNWTLGAELGEYYDTDFEVTYKSGRVVQIETTLPKFRTRSGLCAGSTLDEIRRRVQPLVHSQRSALAVENLMGHEFDGVRLGIAFETSGPHNGDLYHDDSAQSLIVHRRGVPTIPNKGTDWISSESGLGFLDDEGQP